MLRLSSLITANANRAALSDTVVPKAEGEVDDADL